MNTLTYVYDNKIYLNLTNKCSNNCEFCIRHTGDGVLDYYLWLDKEPTADEVIEDLKKYDLSKYKEAVFCGFGEPLYASATVLQEMQRHLRNRQRSCRLMWMRPKLIRMFW